MKRTFSGRRTSTIFGETHQQTSQNCSLRPGNNSSFDLHRCSEAPKRPLPLVSRYWALAGRGKTHVLSSVRHRAFEQGQYFVLVDMTDVREFWETVLLGFLRSLDQQYNGEAQFARLLRRLIARLGADAPSYEQLAKARPPGLMNRCNELIRNLSRQYRTEAREHQDVLRALALVASDDFDIQERGYQWLQGSGIGEDEGFHHDLHRCPQEAGADRAGDILVDEPGCAHGGRPRPARRDRCRAQSR